MRVYANFKTNKTREEVGSYIKILDNYLEVNSIQEDIKIFPPFTAFIDNSKIKHAKIGAQNIYPIRCGAYTGEIGLEQLEEFHIDSILIGHSERRSILQETQEMVTKKFNFAKEYNLEVTYCIGEPLEVRENGLEAVLEYLFGQFDGIDINYQKLIIAYEPIWAIGTGKSATIDDIKVTLEALSKRVNRPLLYGGSVNIDNIQEIVSLKNCYGVLIGGASLDVENFCKIVKKTSELKN